ncbi:hypothetical protein BOO69_06070 [Sulfitobacter alexandrii]|uniref:NAD glycohydrolase translocation F5/8 type C domain-containing protein n=1 Tax=Sulfitobacter alexandrii TaxID=1917485 RepID=A0A1J0WFS4_9RHOB|nr:M48 family metalloprotease [Sulfitobacter alexandrii]APE43032.1 hypothetical protein BOO69_06070 [Sulfitobacter alexandrii]
MPPFAKAPLALLMMLALPVRAEEQVACTILGCEKVNIEISDFAAADAFSVQEVWSVVNDILGVSGLAPNFQVVETQEVGNAAAVIIDEQRYLAFNPVWMRTYRDKPDSNWQLYAVMAHEVGHHLQGHTITAGGSRPPTELEADEYAGFTLAALGATLDETQALWKSFGEQGSATHPPRYQRLAAVQRGWERRKGAAGPVPATPVAQQPAPPAAQARAPAMAGESCRQLTLGAGPARVCASSTLESQGRNSYVLTNMFDNDLATAWVEGVGGTGEGQRITVSFDRPTTVRRLGVVTGYAKSQDIFLKNGRVRELYLEASNRAEGAIALRDDTTMQAFDTTGLDAVSWISLTIRATYPGSRYSDTAISELTLD